MAEEKKKITFGNIGNALKSVATDHITTVAGDVFDEERQQYQGEINGIVGSYIENPEFLSVKTDAEGKLLWWIEKDGSVNWSKGVPKPIQVKLQELEQKIKDNADDDKTLAERVTDNETAIVAINEALDNYKAEVAEALSKKMDGEYIENPEFIHVYNDSEGKILWALLKNGKVLYGAGVPDQIMELVNEIYDTFGRYEENQEFIHAHKDSEGKLLWWIEKDGTVGWSKGVPTPIQEELKRLEQLIKDNTEGDESVVGRVAALEVAITKKVDGEYIENPEFIHVLTDSEGRVLWGLLSNGKVMYGAGIPDQISVLIEEIYDTFGRYTDNPEFIEAKCDNAGRLIYGVLTDGDFKFGKIPSQIIKLVSKLKEELTTYINNVDEKVDSIGEWVDNPEYTRVITDSNDRIIDYTDKSGRRWIHDLHADNIPENLSEIEDIEGRVSMETDSNGKIISYRDADGVLHEEKGISTKEINADNVDTDSISCNHIAISDAAATELTEALKKIGFTVETPVDWSNESFINLPSLPTCALLNISGVDSMPTSKKTNAKMTVEVWDMNGNYFKKKCIGNAQGDSSMAHPKKNFALDFCEDDWLGDNTTTIKIGPWVSQDSFHFKAFATSITKAECPLGYKIFEKFLETKPFHKRAPYMEYYEGNYTTNNSPSNDLSQNMQFQARCYPDGFPCIVYLNGAFYGIFSWQLKKHRDNMAMARNETDNIHLDGYLADTNMWNGIVNWKLVEIRNPKPKSSKWTLLCQDGSKYNGDNPKEIMGEDSEFYNAGDKSCKNSAATKTILINATNYMSEIKVFEDAYKGNATEENLNALKAEIEKRFSVEWMVEYVLLMNLLQDGDSITKNIQWATWGAINGTVKWYPLPYDLDTAFGVNSVTAFGFGAPYKSTIGKGAKSPVRYVWDYYYNELVSRYKELREKNVISYNEIMGLFLNWGKAIGYDNYEKEYKKWPESPCNRDSCISPLWQFIGLSYMTYGSSLSTFKYETTYALGAMTSVNGRCYKSLQDGNVGHNPVESPGWWEDVYIKEGTYNKGDVIYDGRTNYYQFRALDTVVVDGELNNRPFTKFYTMYPFEGGSFDSIYRISKWIEEKIKSMDLQFI